MARTRDGSPAGARAAHGRGSAARAALRAAWLAAVVALGLVSLVGSGGGIAIGGFPPCDAPWCNQPAPPPQPAVRVVPPTLTVQVATAASFSAVPENFGGSLSYQWARSADGTAFVDLPGATGSSLRLPSVTLADDGALVRVSVRSSDGTERTATAQLAVSSAPGVVFADGDFALAGWQFTPRELPPGVVPPTAQSREASGGNPGAWLRMVYQIPAGAGSASVFHVRQGAVYVPSVQGAIHVIDHAEDCRMLQQSELMSAESQLLLVQAGRRFVSTHSNACTELAWSGVANRNSLRARDFAQLDGPACGSGEACPDFSAGAPPLQLGFRRIAWGTPGDVIGHGIDNWRVTVWRR